MLARPGWALRTLRHARSDRRARRTARSESTAPPGFSPAPRLTWTTSLALGWLVPLASLSSLGCAGSAPLLHPAHVEPEGVVTMGAGMSGQLAVGQIASSIQAARESTAAPLGAQVSSQDAYNKGALALASIAPGVAPWVSGRVGLAHESEGGITYTARSLRIDARHAFQTHTWALSLGGGISGTLARRENQGADLHGLDLSGVSGYGGDVPILVGWRSEAGIFSFWGGPRFGFEHLRGNIGLGAAGVAPGSTPQPLGSTVDVSANRWWVGGLLGMTIGFRHLFVSLEIDASYNDVNGTFGDTAVKVQGFSLAPGGALQARF